MDKTILIAHLGFVQNVINRLGNNSFLIKGWTVALTAAIFALANSKSNLIAALLITVFFWIMDAYFLWQERIYRGLYKKIVNGESVKEFDMDAVKYIKEDICFCKAFLSKTIICFYGATILLFLGTFFFFKDIQNFFGIDA